MFYLFCAPTDLGVGQPHIPVDPDFLLTVDRDLDYKKCFDIDVGTKICVAKRNMFQKKKKKKHQDLNKVNHILISI